VCQLAFAVRAERRLGSSEQILNSSVHPLQMAALPGPWQAGFDINSNRLKIRPD
jgi:hypothetical protein